MTDFSALASPYYKLNNGQLDLDHCEDWIGDVWCKKPLGSNHTLYCYYSLCDAVTDGVSSCKPAQSPCEPR